LGTNSGRGVRNAVVRKHRVTKFFKEYQNDEEKTIDVARQCLSSLDVGSAACSSLSCTNPYPYPDPYSYPYPYPYPNTDSD